MSNNTLFGFFKAPKEIKADKFDFEFITLVKREGDKDNYKIQLSRSAKELFDFEGFPEQKVGVIADLINNNFSLVNLGKTDMVSEGIRGISATGSISSKRLYIALAEAFELDITEDSYLKVIGCRSMDINGELKKVIEVTALPEEEVVTEEMISEEVILEAEEEAYAKEIEESEDMPNPFGINEDIPESDEFGV